MESHPILLHSSEAVRIGMIAFLLTSRFLYSTPITPMMLVTIPPLEKASIQIPAMMTQDRKCGI